MIQRTKCVLETLYRNYTIAMVHKLQLKPNNIILDFIAEPCQFNNCYLKISFKDRNKIYEINEWFKFTLCFF